jgi:hypothetical protein
MRNAPKKKNKTADRFIVWFMFETIAKRKYDQSIDYPMIFVNKQKPTYYP